MGSLSEYNCLSQLIMQHLILGLTYVFELYHSLGHLTVLTGYRMLPRKDLVSVRYYFLLDAACAAWAYYIHQAEYFYPILILQQWQHIYYYSTWDKSWAAKRVISWSNDRRNQPDHWNSHYPCVVQDGHWKPKLCMGLESINARLGCQENQATDIRAEARNSVDGPAESQVKK